MSSGPLVPSDFSPAELSATSSISPTSSLNGSISSIKSNVSDFFRSSGQITTVLRLLLGLTLLTLTIALSNYLLKVGDGSNKHLEQKKQERIVISIGVSSIVALIISGALFWFLSSRGTGSILMKILTIAQHTLIWYGTLGLMYVTYASLSMMALGIVLSVMVLFLLGGEMHVEFKK